MAETISRDHTFEAARVSTVKFVNGQIVIEQGERGQRTESYDAQSMQQLADNSQKEVLARPEAAHLAASYEQKAIGLRALDQAPAPQNTPGAPASVMKPAIG